MTLDELCLSLPNGFHDAELTSLTVDYVAREARLTLDVWLGDMEGPFAERETYRSAEVTLTGLAFWAAEPPRQDGSSIVGAEVIDVGPMEALSEETRGNAKLPHVQAGCFLNWIFFVHRNAFAFVSAADATIAWRGEAIVRQDELMDIDDE